MNEKKNLRVIVTVVDEEDTVVYTISRKTPKDYSENSDCSTTLKETIIEDFARQILPDIHDMIKGDCFYITMNLPR